MHGQAARRINREPLSPLSLAVCAYLTALNTSLVQPLPLREVEGIAKSVVNISSTNLASGQTQAQFSRIQAARGRKGGRIFGAKRYQGSNEATQPWKAEGVSRRTWYHRQTRQPQARTEQQGRNEAVREERMGKTRLVGLALANLFSSTAVSSAAVLESPAQGGALSGLGFISGWKCDAGNITVTIDGGKPLPVALPQARRDLRPVRGPIRPGFIMQLNWTVLGDGAHEVVAYDDGVEFDRATFTVGSTGAEFLEDVVRRTVIDGVPAPGESAFLEWNASTQHFAILAVWTSGRTAAYDRAWWRRYNQDLGAGTYTTQEFLYDEAPDVAACEPGALAVGARSRARWPSGPGAGRSRRPTRFAPCMTSRPCATAPAMPSRCKRPR